MSAAKTDNISVRADVVETARGARCRVFRAGPEKGTPVVFLHGVAGLLDDHRFQHALARAGYRVMAPELPGYGESGGEGLLEDMLDFTLHGWDVVDAMDIDRPVLIGHSMGGMIAAEMASVCPRRPLAVVLVAPIGLWDDAHPIPDLFSLLPFEFAPLLFRDADAGAAMLTGGLDFSDMEALTEFFIGNARRLGTAGRILFPIPNRRLSKRLYRLRAPTLIAWGAEDRYLVTDVYADHWRAGIPHAEFVRVDDAGHMAPYDQPAALAKEVVRFLGRAGASREA